MRKLNTKFYTLLIMTTLYIISCNGVSDTPEITPTYIPITSTPTETPTVVPIETAPPTPTETQKPNDEVLPMSQDMEQFCTKFAEIVQEERKRYIANGDTGYMFFSNNNARLDQHMETALKLWGQGIPIDWSKCFGNEIFGYKSFNGVPLGGALDFEQLKTINGQVVLIPDLNRESLISIGKVFEHAQVWDLYSGDLRTNLRDYPLLGIVFTNNSNTNVNDLKGGNGKWEDLRPPPYIITDATRVNLPPFLSDFVFIPSTISYDEGVIEFMKSFEDQDGDIGDSHFIGETLEDPILVDKSAFEEKKP